MHIWYVFCIDVGRNVYMYVHSYTYMLTYIHTPFMYGYTYTDIFRSEHTYIFLKSGSLLTYTHMPPYISAYIYVYIYAYPHLCMHAYI